MSKIIQLNSINLRKSSNEPCFNDRQQVISDSLSFIEAKVIGLSKKIKVNFIFLTIFKVTRMLLQKRIYQHNWRTK